jgi:hypothetical protein
MRTSSQTPVTFVPKWNGNQELPENEQIRVTVKFPTAKEFEPFDLGPGRMPKQTALVEAFVPKIENYYHNDQPVESGEALVACEAKEVYQLVAEIFLYLWRGISLGEEREKN